MYGYGYRYSIRPGYVPFNPLTDIDGLQLYLNKNTNVNTKVAADFVRASNESLSSVSADFEPTTSFTIGGWFNIVTGVGSAQYLMAHYGGALSGERKYRLIQGGAETIGFYVYDSSNTQYGVFSSALSSGWHFIVGVYDDANDLIKVSIDGGNFTTSASGTDLQTSTADFRIGSNSLPSDGFDGSADSPFFYDKALTLAEVKALYNSNLGVDYPSLTDLNGTQYAIGQSLNGTDQAFNIDSVLTPLASTTTGTIEFSAKVPDATPTLSSYFISFGDTDAVGVIGCYINATDGKITIVCAELGTVYWRLETDAQGLIDNTWATIKIVHNGTQPTIYINDVAVAQTFTTDVDRTYYFNSCPSLDNGRIGNLTYNSSAPLSWLYGSIQNVKIWSDDTQTTQVAEWLMNDVEGANQTDSVGTYDATPIGTPISTLASVNNTTIETIESSLVDWWRLNETSGNRSGELGHTLTDNNTVGYALGKVQEVTETGELVWNWIDQSSNAFVFKNDTVTKQPLLSANSIDFDGTDDSLENGTANVFSGDSSGIIFFSGYFDNSFLNLVLSSADTSVTTKYIYFLVDSSGAFGVNIHDGTTANAMRSTNTITNGDYYYGYVKSTGTAYEINLNGTIETLSIVSGVDNGKWYADVSGRDNLDLGVLNRTTSVFGTTKINKVIYSNDHTIDTTPILNFLSNPDN